MKNACKKKAIQDINNEVFRLFEEFGRDCQGISKALEDTGFSPNGPEFERWSGNRWERVYEPQICQLKGVLHLLSD